MTIDMKKKEPSLDEVLEDLQQRVERLKILYEQYFMGLQKLQPLVPRREIQRKMTELAQTSGNFRSTKHRFLFNMLNQRWQSYTTYWNRTCAQMENGTYYRDVARAKRNAAKRAMEMPETTQARRDIERDAATGADSDKMFDAGEMFAGADADIDSMFDQIADTRASSGPPMPASMPPPSRAADLPTTPPRERHITRPGIRAAKRAESSPGLPPPTPTATPAATRSVEEVRMRSIYDRYVAAKKQVGESTDKITYESIVRTIQKTTPSVMAQHNAKSVDFDIAIKDNKVILKAIPRK